METYRRLTVEAKVLPAYRAISSCCMLGIHKAEVITAVRILCDKNLNSNFSPFAMKNIIPILTYTRPC